MADPIRVLLKTTIATTEDDWHVGRFSRLAARLAAATDAAGRLLYAVTACDRRPNTAGDDADLAEAADGVYDQLWLIAVDVTGALTPGDARNVAAFRARGGGVYLTRDHQDLGACLATLAGIGETQHFQSVNPEDPERRKRDDVETAEITWPNYHSGANGALQRIETPAPDHPLVRRASGGTIERLPAHPHEGAVCAPASLGAAASVVVRGRSQTTGLSFDLAVAVDEPGQGRTVSDASFHHIADYNWDPRDGCPSFVTEPPADEVIRDPDALADTFAYVENIAAWLARRT
jgi:hypothetical protein